MTDNPHVREGFSLNSIIWAFSVNNNTAYWHPVTWISHMLDCRFFNLNAGMHHLTNLVIHIANTLLLFLLLQQMTGAIWQSTIVAALFAVHPVNVDSVAWIAERKNVLSTLFWMLSMLAYIYYTRRPGIQRYFLIMLSLSIGLMAKSMLVTLPCVFLLLDFWPLHRFELPGIKTGNSKLKKHPNYLASLLYLVLEKLPLLLLSFIAMLLSRQSLQNYHQLLSTATVPMDLRISNALITYVKYIFKIVWPQNLSVFYPFPESVPLWQVVSASAFLLIVTGSVILLAKKAPYLVVGWFWYLGVLFPVIGLVQGGLWPEMADRWLYVPAIGLFIMISWSGTALLAKFPRFKLVFASLTVMIIATLMLTAGKQVSHWKNSKALFKHALDVTTDNHAAHFHLGIELLNANNIDKAIEQFNQALAIKNNFPEAQIGLGDAMMKKSDFDKAIDCYHQALWMSINQEDDLFNKLGNAFFQKGLFEQALTYVKKSLKENPDNPVAGNNMGNILIKMNKPDEAVTYYQQALQLKPDDTELLNNLSNAYLITGEIRKAVKYLNQALTIEPQKALTLNNIGTAYFYQGQYNQAEKFYLSAIEINPEYSDAHFNLALVLVRRGKIDPAIEQYLEVIGLTPDHAKAHKNLADIYFNTNQIDRAIDHYRKSLDSASENPQTNFNLGIALYQKNDLSASIRYIQKALELNPGYAQAEAALKELLATEKTANCR
ncbi:MAG: tetratricopeptide repeat protein [Desulfobacteraceae bacterium]|nr:tetratricopeptide repeat protein [Desulfobacteraceae bacterium]MBC2758186.1 tetratricopeptide repeat protein [Desulfobacteraceae bacterium]